MSSYHWLVERTVPDRVRLDVTDSFQRALEKVTNDNGADVGGGVWFPERQAWVVNLPERNYMISRSGTTEPITGADIDAIRSAEWSRP